jgi:hypothetical protein
MKRMAIHTMLRAGLLLYALTRVLCAQSTQPDCIIFFHFSAAGQTSPTSPNAGLDNRTNGCTTWNVSYARSGFTATNVALESAPNSSGSPGTWVTYAGATVINGTNPLTDAAEAFAWVVGYNPWVRVTLRVSGTSGSGTVDGAAYGWRIPSAGAGSTATANVNIAQYGGVATSLGQKVSASSIPVVLASDQTGVGFNLAQINAHTVVEGGINGSLAIGGTAADGASATAKPVEMGGVDAAGVLRKIQADSAGVTTQYVGCNLTAEVALSSTTYTEIVAGVASKVINVCKVLVTSSSGGNPTVNTFTIAKATVTSCASATELVNAAGITGIDSDFGGALKSGASQSICVKEATAQSDKVTITYSIYIP